MEKYCTWTHQIDEFGDDDYWTTSCDNIFAFIEGNPKDNHFVYCPYCGRVIKAVLNRILLVEYQGKAKPLAVVD